MERKEMRMEEEKRKEDEIFDRLCSPGGMRRKEMDGYPLETVIGHFAPIKEEVCVLLRVIRIEREEIKEYLEYIASSSDPSMENWRGSSIRASIEKGEEV
uniref:Uncharacterized protein n=1 Tax=Pristionchus pacificus TaxID=54126 RepID=A0A2A6CBW9_PRIPA|eukprot:PDM75521.1 hypothetical protein PRIPAC_42698 [Pristionchus pacificus]